MKILIIQTAFIGDVVLATPVIENLAATYPAAKIDFLLRKGNENLLEGHPHIHQLLVWNKKQNKYKGLLKLVGQIRQKQYDFVINLQRFASTGFLTALSKGKSKIGFAKNPFSFTFSSKISHQFAEGTHEVDRNLELIKNFANVGIQRLALHPSQSDYSSVSELNKTSYVCIAPASVWFTKQLPIEQWIKLCQLLSNNYKVCFIGAPGDVEMCEQIAKEADLENYTNYCGKLSFLQSAALMEKAAMCYVNDSAPLHFASAVNAKVTAFFCSTIPEFGFGPIADEAQIAQVEEKLDCRPCGLHGKKMCPKGHFDCGYKINLEKYLPK